MENIIKESFKNDNVYKFNNYVMVTGKVDIYFIKVNSGCSRSYCTIIKKHDSNNEIYRGTCNKSLKNVIAEAKKVLKDIR